MRYRMVFGVGMAVGYVLGSRAGRERYEQIKRAARRVADSPTVQEAAGLVGAQVSKASELAKDTLQHRVPFLGKGQHDSGVGWPDEVEDQKAAKDTLDRSGMPY